MTEQEKPKSTVIIEIEFTGANGETLMEMGFDEELDAKGVIEQMKIDSKYASAHSAVRMLQDWNMLDFPNISVEVTDGDGKTTRAEWNPI